MGGMPHRGSGDGEGGWFWDDGCAQWSINWFSFFTILPVNFPFSTVGFADTTSCLVSVISPEKIFSSLYRLIAVNYLFFFFLKIFKSLNLHLHNSFECLLNKKSADQVLNRWCFSHKFFISNSCWKCISRHTVRGFFFYFIPIGRQLRFFSIQNTTTLKIESSPKRTS